MPDDGAQASPEASSVGGGESTAGPTPPDLAPPAAPESAVPEPALRPAVASQPGAHAAPRRSSLGIWALALALLGLTFLPIVGSTLGFVLGRVAIRRADSRQVIGGRGLAIAAVVISIVTLVVIALAVAGYALSVAYLGI